MHLGYLMYISLVTKSLQKKKKTNKALNFRYQGHIRYVLFISDSRHSTIYRKYEIISNIHIKNMQINILTVV